ncbi:zinc finger protein 2 -like, partial [Asbolus verrucosus]
MSKMKVRTRKINLNKVCRACLSERGHLREIFSTKLPKMMESCAVIQVSDKDDLPPHVCVTCFHLIAKFYTFKKKMERSDRILRSYTKQSKVKQKNILDIAISEAQIEQSNNDDLGEVSEEDIPLSKRQVKKNSRLLRRSKVKANKIIDDILKDDKDNNSEISEDNSETIIKMEQEIKCDFQPQEYPDGPPPLVPLEPAKKIDNNESLIVKTLPKDPPPLIPIKPLVVPDNVLTNVIENPIEINLQCTTCSQQFNSLSALKDHKLNSCKENILMCNICRKEFKERKRLIGHLKGHMVVKDYGCKICGKRYPNPSTFRVHMRTHTGERPFKCQICNKGFVRWAGVVGHMRTHQSHKPYKCDTCGKGFKISSNLERHKVLHSESLPFCCSYCGKTFSQSDNLQLHIRTYHTNERPYLCNECGKGFVSSTRLNRHMWVHTGYKPYRCKTCPKAYSNSNDLKNHERNHSGNISDEDKPYVCKICEMRFYHPCRLSKHMKTHERPYSCSICFKSFSTNALLNKHLTGKKSMHYVQVEEVQHDNGEVSTNICRACLTETGDFQSIFVPAEETGLSIHISEMIMAFASVQITFGDGLPERICSTCAKDTVKMYLFKLKCEESDKILRNRLGKSPLEQQYSVEEKHSAERDEDEDAYDIVIKPEINSEDSQMNQDVSDDFDSFNAEDKSDNEIDPSDLLDDVTEKEFKCPHCSKLFSRRTTLNRHVKTHSAIKAYKCDTCNKRFSRNDLLLRHKIAHAMKMDEQKFDFDDFSEDIDDTIIIKTETALYPCTDCNVIFIKKDELESHMQDHVKSIGGIVCKVCLKKFSKQAHLNRHMKIHSQNKPHVCQICKKGFVRAEQLNNHMNVHSGIKLHVCAICLKGFNQISNLKDHMRTHSGEKPFLCSTCGKGFNQLGNLRQHTIRHSGIKAHLCSTCGNGFASKGELSAHLRKHTGARPFVCPICNHGFTTSSSLTKHKRIHSGEKPYECDVCKMKFS